MKPKRPTLNETIRANEKALRGLCMLGGKPMPEGFDTPAVERKTRAPAIVTKDSDNRQVPLEHDEQRAFVKWFHAQFPTVLIFAVPNAAMRDHKLAAYLRAEGMFAGIPDLHIPEWRVVIEMKRQKNSTTSTEQFWCEAYYKRIGWTHFFGYGFEDARQKVLTVSNP